MIEWPADVAPETESEEWYRRMAENHPDADASPLWGVMLVVNGAPDRLGVERTWPDYLHPADVLEKHVFRQIADRLDHNPKNRRTEKMNALEQLGISADSLRDEVIERAADRLVESYVSDDEVRAAIEKIVTTAIDQTTERIAAEEAGPLIEEKIEGVVLQRTNEWGEPKGEPLTFVGYLVQRAEAYLTEPVDYKGKPKAESGAYGWKPTQTRIAWMIDEHLQYSIKTAMEEALKTADSAIAGGIAETVKIKLREVSAALKVEVKKR